MTLPNWHEEPVSKLHRRQEFDCGDSQMNLFLQRYARQSHDRGASKTFCAIDNTDGGRILGFYTVAPSSIEREGLPAAVTRGLSLHDVPGYRLARVATDVNVAGMGIGSQLVAHAALRCVRAAEEVGGVLLIIDAKNEQAAKWYVRLGAYPLPERPLTLVMPLEPFRAAFFAGSQL
jgi:ribosomal protein S18 acetylase RimI-like enzyme